MKKPRLTIQQKLRKARRALKIANSVMEYCRGDKWERECTEKERKQFNKIYEELTNDTGMA